MMVSPAGGMEIEELAREKPELIFKEAIDPFLGLLPYQARVLSFKAGLPDLRQAVKLLLSLYKLFVNYDCSLAEINPLALTSEGQLLAIDAKLNFDDSGLFATLKLKRCLTHMNLTPWNMKP